MPRRGSSRRSGSSRRRSGSSRRRSGSSRRRSGSSRRRSGSSRRRSGSSPGVNWGEMGSGMQSDISHISRVSSGSQGPEWDFTPSGSPQLFDLGSTRRALNMRSQSPRDNRVRRRSPSMTSSDRAEEARGAIAEANWLREEEHAAGVRICYTGPVPQGHSGRKSDGTYTIKQFLKLATVIHDDRANNPSSTMPDITAPPNGREYTNSDVERLLVELQADACSTKYRDRGGLSRCQDCEDEMKDPHWAAYVATLGRNRDEPGARTRLERMEAADERMRIRRMTRRAAEARTQSGGVGDDNVVTTQTEKERKTALKRAGDVVERMNAENAPYPSGWLGGTRSRRKRSRGSRSRSRSPHTPSPRQSPDELLERLEALLTEQAPPPETRYASRRRGRSRERSRRGGRHR